MTRTFDEYMKNIADLQYRMNRGLDYLDPNINHAISHVQYPENPFAECCCTMTEDEPKDFEKSVRHGFESDPYLDPNIIDVEYKEIK